MRVIGFDPATDRFGWAVLDGTAPELLVACGISRFDKLNFDQIRLAFWRVIHSYMVCHPTLGIAIEVPDDQGIVGRTTGVQADLAAVSYYIGGLADGQAEFTTRTGFIPVQRWKGSVPKEIIYNRLREIYKDRMPVAITPTGRKAKRYWETDAGDAIGIARFYHTSL